MAQVRDHQAYVKATCIVPRCRQTDGEKAIYVEWTKAEPLLGLEQAGSSGDIRQSIW